MQVLVLLTDLFDAIGGIQTFSRCVVRALNEISEESNFNITLLVLNDPASKTTTHCYFNTEKIQYFAYKRFKLGFITAIFRQALNASVVIIGHINFVPLAICLHLLCPQLKIFLVLYDVDIQKKLSFLQRFGLKQVDCILSISRDTKERIVLLNKLSDSTFNIFPCTLEPSFTSVAVFKSRRELLLPAGKMILTVARLDALHKFKNIDLVIQLMPTVLGEIPNAFYVVVGDGTDRMRLEQMAGDLKLSDKVIFVGEVEEELLPSYYQACDIFVLPSTFEGFGIVFLEAMYHAKPCIGAKVGGVPEVINDGETGFLVEKNNKVVLTEKIIELLKNENLRQTMGGAGKKKFEKEFSFDKFKKRLKEVLCH